MLGNFLFLPTKIFLTCLTCLLDAEPMSISGEEIRAARERAHLTQEELAQAVGVSMRTVGNWERGESVPRSRMAAVEEVLGMHMNGPVPTSKQEMQVKVGELARQRRGELGLGAVRFAEAAGIGSDRTIKSFEAGLTSPDVMTQRKLENALGWRRGVIRDLLKAGDEGSIEPADIDMEYVDGWEPVTRASKLEDAEVLAEAIKRLERWQKLLNQDPTPVPGAVPEQVVPWGLAARSNMEPEPEPEDDTEDEPEPQG